MKTKKIVAVSGKKKPYKSAVMKRLTEVVSKRNKEKDSICYDNESSGEKHD